MPDRWPETTKAFLSASKAVRWGIPLLILLLALLPRVLSLNAFLTADEDDQLVFASRFLQMIMRRDWAGAVVLGYPGVPTMALGAFGLWARYQLSLVDWGTWLDLGTFAQAVRASTPIADQTQQIFIPLFTTPPPDLSSMLALVPQNPLWFIQAVRLPLALAVALSVLLSFLLLRRLLALPLAFLGATLIAFEPIFLANSRIIHVDALVSCFMFTSFLAFLLYLKEGRWRWLIGSGVLGGLAVLSKTPAVLLGPILTGGGLLYLWSSPDQLERRTRLKRLGVALLGWGLVAAVAFVVLWPSMWVKPVAALTRMSGDVWRALQTPHPASGQFWGSLVTDQSPWYYLIAFPFQLTPLISIGLLGGLAMIGVGLRDRWRRQDTFAARYLPLALATFAYILVFALPVSIVARRGVRYLLPIFLAADLLAALGLWWLAGLINEQWGRLLLIPIVTVQVVVVLSFHPYYFDYFNPLLGGGRTAPNYVVIGWGEGLDQAAAYLNRQPKAEQKTVAAWYSWQFENYFVGQTVDLASNEPAYLADYVVFYINQIQRGFPSRELLDYFQARTPERVINLRGIDYAWIYPGPIIGATLPADLTQYLHLPFGGSLLLAGLQLPSSGISDELPLTLYWQTINPVPGDFNVSVRLVDESGQVWGQIDRLPIGGLVRTNKWGRGQVIRDDYRLPLEPGTPPGVYTLDILMYDFETGQVFGEARQVGRVIVLLPDNPVDLETARSKITHPLDAQLTSELKLIGHTLEPYQILPGKKRTIKLYWYAQEPSPADQPVSLIAHAASGQEFLLLNELIGPFQYGTSQWRRGQVVGEAYTFAFPLDAPPGTYDILAHSRDSGQALLGQVTVVDQMRVFELPPAETEAMQPFEARLGDAVRLRGFRSTYTAAGVDLTLYWQAIQTPPDDYKIFVHLADMSDRIIAQRDQIPVDGQRPTTTWVPGEWISEHYQIGLPPGEYRLWVGMYLPQTGDRLPASSRAGSVSDNRILLTTIQVSIHE